MQNNLSDFLSGGFYVTRFVERPAFVTQDFLPSKILSVSDCIVSFIPDTWAIEWTCDKQEYRLQEADKFGLSKELKEIVSWVTSKFDKEIGWPNVCYSLSTAKEICRKFLSKSADVVILEIGLHKTSMEKFVDFTKPPAQQQGYAPVGESGLRSCIAKRNSLGEGAFLGFELLVTGEHTGNLEDSWLCNGLEKEASAMGISLNPNGFIERYEDAKKFADRISSGAIGAEPGLWLPWAIVRHDGHI